MSKFTKELETAKKIALQSGEIILKYFDADQQVETKVDKSPVTIADKLVNELTIKQLAKEFPEDGVIGEEKSTTEYGGGRKWFCDPIDGTAGYIWGTPTAMFSLALVIDGNPVIGVAYDPFLKRMYSGIKGEGSFMNDEKLHVSSEDLNEGRVALTGSAALINKLTYVTDLTAAGAKLAAFSGAVYKSCLIAKGKLIAYIEYGVSGHDMAAVQVIVEEAGGKITGLNGETLDYSKPFKGSVVSNGIVHAQILKIINKV